MASATGMPENPEVEAHEEDEPLLGRAGDVSQQEGKGIQFNFFIGTAVIAQVGIWLLAATIWASIFIHPLMLFSAHPVRRHMYTVDHILANWGFELLNSAGILLMTQAILVLQPTHTPRQKKQGTNVHAVLNLTGILSLIVGLIVIEINKGSHPHFTSPHGILGLITYCFLVVQALIGVTQYYAMGLYGGEVKAKSIWKYHRMSGYLILVLFFATVAAATQTDFNKNVLHIKLWAIIITSLLVLMGVIPRIKKQKLGI
ncbi:hypothetical protein MMC06_001530 [Schaereria dolodes]|nr:hypothetical protein [Schaereria dolodes]